VIKNTTDTIASNKTVIKNHLGKVLKSFSFQNICLNIASGTNNPKKVISDKIPNICIAMTMNYCIIDA